ncbi:hypothetical protein WJX72_006404 [[Myrmecia] bisecta]|uniref:RWD domain-containing protein n=1 Tax=[Myrmecia] bisecta TaxID=41462 RepID=A0AAW1R6T4_9CHLO
MEIEALQAILMEEFQELPGSKPAGWDTDAPCYLITILPSQEDAEASTSGVEVGIEIVFAHTPSYPDEAPLVKARSIRGLSPEDLAQLQALLEQTAQENLGMAMIYALVSAAQEWLRDKVLGDGAGEAVLDPEEAKKRREEEEERKLAEIRSHGTPVTPQTFVEWKQRFDAEIAAIKARSQDSTAKEVDKGPTGKEFFLQQEALGKEAEEESEVPEDDEDYEAEYAAEANAEAKAEGSDEEEDFDPDELDDDEEDDAFLDEYLSKKTLAVSAANNGPDVPPEKQGFIAKILRPLRDFGVGRTSLWEGGVGLFVFVGIGFALLLTTWARGGQLGRKGGGYQAVLEFPLACGISTGTPVRIRGVPVGSVLSVQPSLERVKVLAEIKDVTTVIPRNSLIEANQSGLIAEPLIDITPQLPIPDYVANPLDPDCEKEGKVVCHQGHIKGQPGVALDDLVYICTKIARQMDANGLDKVFDAAEAATATIEEARPLLARTQELIEEVTPLLNELRQGSLVGNLEEMTKTVADVMADVRKLENEVLTPENVRALRDSIVTLTKCAENLETVTSDFAGVTGDAKVKTHLKQLIEALSRVVSD